MKDDNWPLMKDGSDEFPSALYQRTEELYQLPDAETDQDGLIELPALVMRDMIVFPHMVSPIFVAQGVNLQAMHAS